MYKNVVQVYLRLKSTVRARLCPVKVSEIIAFGITLVECCVMLSTVLFENQNR